jgi:ABC-type dipeptide/oligopeptide/nickel transport system permease component
VHRYVLRRALLIVPVLLAAYTVTFLLIQSSPGSPWDTERRLTPEQRANLNARYGLDRPIWVQYTTYLANAVLRLDFGESFTSKGQQVRTIVAERLPVTLRLGLLAMLVGLLVGVPLGVISAVRQNTWIDYLATLGSVLGISLPSFVVGPILVLVFALGLSQLSAGTIGLPTGGWPRRCDWLVLCDRPETMILPVLTLALQPAALLARYTRAAMLEVIHQDFIRTARAKGLTDRVVILRHALRNALIPVTTVAGAVLALVVTGAFFVETVFSVPGLAREAVNSVINRDYPVLLAVTLLFAALISVINLVVDVSYAYQDPRITYR